MPKNFIMKHCIFDSKIVNSLNIQCNSIYYKELELLVHCFERISIGDV